MAVVSSSQAERMPQLEKWTHVSPFPVKERQMWSVVSSVPSALTTYPSETAEAGRLRT